VKVTHVKFELLILIIILFLSGTACEQDRITKKTESRKNVQQKKVQQLVPPQPKPKNLSVKQSTQQNQIDSFSEESSTEDNTDLQSDITSPSSEHILSSKNIEETTSEDPIEISKREGELRAPIEVELPANLCVPATVCALGGGRLVSSIMPQPSTLS